METGSMPTSFTVFAAWMPVHTLASPFLALMGAGSNLGHRQWVGCREQVRLEQGNGERAAAPAQPHKEAMRSWEQLLCLPQVMVTLSEGQELEPLH